MKIYLIRTCIMLCLVPLLNVNPFERGEVISVHSEMTATNSITNVRISCGKNQIVYPKSIRLRNNSINDTPSIMKDDFKYSTNLYVGFGQIRKAK